MTKKSKKKTLAETVSSALLDQGAIAVEALETARLEAEEAGQSLEKYLLEHELAPADLITLAVANYVGMPPIRLAHYSADADLLQLVPREAMEKHTALPIAKTGKMLTVALGDPFDIFAVDEIHTLTGLEVMPVAAMEAEVRMVLGKSLADEAGSLDMGDIMKGADDDDELQMGSALEEGDIQSIEDMMESAEEGPVVRMVNMILVEAVKLGANDIHIEPQEDYVRLRYRVDGGMVEQPNLPKGLQAAIVSRVKIMSELDIGENRIPQDGRFRIKTLGKDIDVRVSILPTIFGGRVVMRTLDKSSLFPNLSALDLDKRALAALEYAIEQPHGIILVTGPTGSGKTTTLYSCLQDLNKPDVNVVTCEDPVEYQIPGIIQVKINEAVGCTFAASLRAILRQDPDVVLIGEIRDGETAEIAIKAALTGHLVLSTLHANDAPSTITRLLDMGLEPFLLSSSIILAQAQRLYRRLCPSCKRETNIPTDAMREHHLDPAILEGGTIYEPVGCPKCHGIGYKGRGAIMEVLVIDDDIRNAIVQQLMVDEIRAKAAATGMVSLQDSAWRKVREGETSAEIAFRLTG